MKNLIKLLSILALLAIIGFSMAACGDGGGDDGGSTTPGGSTGGGDNGDTTVAVTGVTLSPTTLSLTVGGDTGTLTATVAPDDATNKGVTWSSSDTSKVTVSTSGVVTAVAVGTATISVTTTDGNFSATCKVTVTPVAVTGVTLSSTTLSLKVGGDKGTLTATVAPSNATNKGVTWSSSDTSKATVSTSGVVTAVSAGMATITVTTADGNKTTTCEVTVSYYNIGDLGPGGGKIFYVDTSGFTVQMVNPAENYTVHYLEAALVDIPNLKWTTSANYISGTDTVIGTGRKNTYLILASDENAPAAKACKDLTTGDKTDWFLPSKDELNELYTNRSLFDNLGTDSYWSSSRKSDGRAWYHDFTYGQFDTWDDTPYSVRAVRAF